MVSNFKKLLGDDLKLLYTPIALLMFDVLGNIGLLLTLRFALLDIYNNTFTIQKLMIYSLICLTCVVYRIALFPKGFTSSFMRGADLGQKVRIRLAEHIRSLKLGYFNENSKGYLLNTMTTDVATFESSLSHTLPFVVKYLSMGVLIVIGSFFIDFKLAIAEVVLIGISIPVLRLSETLLVKYEYGQRKIQDKVISIIMEYMDGISTFKSYNMTGAKFERLLSSFENLRKSSIQIEKKLAPCNMLFSIIVDFLTPLIILLGTYLLLGGNIEAESLISFVIITLVFSNMLKGFSHYYTQLKRMNLATLNLIHTMELKPLPYIHEDVKFDNFHIEFDDVSFSYETGKQVLNDISFTAPQGSVTALIGSSGSGKSTIASLIARFWDTDKGHIKIGGYDIKEINPDFLLQHIGMVFQEVYLMSDTVFNNIALGRPSASYEEVIAAAKSANCHDFITNLPDGYNTVLSEGGGTLSGGEKQRISIARAFLKNAPILLLDESTSALDADNEQQINKALANLMQGKTTFVIAHRLDTIVGANQILLLNNGKIEESGDNQSLLQRKGQYYQLIKEQERARQWAV